MKDAREPKALLVDALQTDDAVAAAAPSRKRFGENSEVPMLLFGRNRPHVLRLGAYGCDKQVFWLRGRPTGPTFPRRPARRLAIAKWLNFRAFVARYSGGTARDLHPVVYSPAHFTAREHLSKTTICCGCLKNHRKE